MYAAVISGQLRHGNADAFVRVYRDHVLPIAQTIDGFQSVRVLVNWDTANVLVMALYDTEAHAEAVGKSPQFQAALGALAPLMAGHPVREICAVALEG